MRILENHILFALNSNTFVRNDWHFLFSFLSLFSCAWVVRNILSRSLPERAQPSPTILHLRLNVIRAVIKARGVAGVSPAEGVV